MLKINDNISKFIEKIVRARQYLICITQTSPIGIQYFGFSAFNASLTEISKTFIVPDEEDKKLKKIRKLNIELRDINGNLMPIGSAASHGNIIIALNINFREKVKDEEKKKFFSKNKKEVIDMVMMVVGDKYLIKVNDLSKSFKNKMDKIKINYEARLKKMAKDNSKRIEEIVSNYEMMLEEYRREIESSTQKRIREHLQGQDRSIKSVLVALAEVKKAKGNVDDSELEDKFDMYESKKKLDEAANENAANKKSDDINIDLDDDDDEFDDLLKEE